MVYEKMTVLGYKKLSGNGKYELKMTSVVIKRTALYLWPRN